MSHIGIAGKIPTIEIPPRSDHDRLVAQRNPSAGIMARCPEEYRERVAQHFEDMHAHIAQYAYEQGVAEGGKPAVARATSEDPPPVAGNRPASLGELAHEMPYREPTTPYERMTPMQKHELAARDPARFEALRADWKRRGSPDCVVDLDAPGPAGFSVRLLGEEDLARRIRR